MWPCKSKHIGVGERRYSPSRHRSSGSAFVILDKTKGWWVVQKDPNGTGDVQVDVAKSGWVPAGTYRTLRDSLVTSAEDVPL
jgi:hypothetical protein